MTCERGDFGQICQRRTYRHILRMNLKYTQSLIVRLLPPWTEGKKNSKKIRKL